MTYWLTLPSVCVAPRADPPSSPKVDAHYRLIRRVFGYPSEISNDHLVLPRAIHEDAEALAAQALKPLLSPLRSDELPDMLIDCRSVTSHSSLVPTYELAERIGLLNALPWALGGQAGAEVPHALVLLCNMLDNPPSSAALVATQRVSMLDARAWDGFYPLGDASAGILISQFPIPKGFRLLGSAVGQGVKGWSSALKPTISNVLSKIAVRETTIQWVIAHQLSPDYVQAVHSAVPQARLLVRHYEQGVDFGCADPLISLSWIVDHRPEAVGGIGLICFAGRFGAVGAIVIQKERERV